MVIPNLEVESNWSWARKHLQGKTKLVNLYHRKDLIDLIKDKLSSIVDEDGPILRRFEQGPFGHLLGWKCGICNGQALNALIGRQILSPSLPEHELWFCINETNIRFSCHEFALITGLCFQPSSFNPSDPQHRASNTGVFQRFCGGIHHTLRELWDLFNGPILSEATPEDYIKVANVLFLYLFVMPLEMRRKPDNWTWVLVDKISAWNEFSWGSYCFKAFLHCFKHVKTHKEKYHIFGAVWSLQIWAIEAIPELASNIALIADPDTLPRCLKWTYKTSRLLDFHKLLESVTECKVNLESSIIEKSKRYFIRSDDVSWLSLKFIEPIKASDLPCVLRAPEAKKRRSKRKVVSEEDDYEPIMLLSAIRSKRRRFDQSNASTSSSSNHICEFREDYIIHKVLQIVDERIIPRIISHMTDHAMPDMIRMMRAIVAEHNNHYMHNEHAEADPQQYGHRWVHEQGVTKSTVMGSYDRNESPHSIPPPSSSLPTEPLMRENRNGDQENGIQIPLVTEDHVTEFHHHDPQSSKTLDVVEGHIQQASRTPNSTVEFLEKMHHPIDHIGLQSLCEEANLRYARDETLKTSAPAHVEVTVVIGPEQDQSQLQLDSSRFPAHVNDVGSIEQPIQMTTDTVQPSSLHTRYFLPGLNDDPTTNNVDVQHDLVGSLHSQQHEPIVEVPGLGIDANELRNLQHHRAEDVAAMLGMGMTKFKRICRMVGIQRWRGRSIRSIDRAVELAKAEGFDADDDAVRHMIQNKQLITTDSNFQLDEPTRLFQYSIQKRKRKKIVCEKSVGMNGNSSGT